jgi:glycosyltransferase involved in cell wall biosynthesis
MGPRIAVISHAAVIAANQEPFAALAAAGGDVTIIAPRSLHTDLRGRVVLAALKGSNARIIGLTTVLGGYRRWLGGQRGIHVIVYQRLAKALDSIRPEVVFVEEEPYSFAAFQAMLWCRSRRVPFVVHQNQNLPRRLPVPFEMIRRRVLASAAACTVRNRSAAGVLRRHGFTGPIADFPHGIDPQRYTADAPDPGVPRPIVGFVGRLVPEKGLCDLIDALGAIRARMPASLLVVGDGPQRVGSEARAHRLNVAARFLGALPHDAVPAWYRAMDVVVVPSRTTPTWVEQFGRVPIEANAAGVPVIVSDTGELGATVDATGGGLVARSPEDLRTQLESLLGDDLARRELGARGARGVRERFTHQAIAVELMDLLAAVRVVRA